MPPDDTGRSLLLVKRGANLANLSFEISILVGALAQQWFNDGLGDFRITSGRREGDDAQSSLHYSGNAVDIGTWEHFENGKHTTALLKFARWIQREYGPRGARVVVEPDWLTEAQLEERQRQGKQVVNHLHVGFKLKKPDLNLWEWTR